LEIFQAWVWDPSEGNQVPPLNRPVPFLRPVTKTLPTATWLRLRAQTPAKRF
jgi:hypothetical protein